MQYGYDANNNLTSITDVDGYKLQIEYTAGSQPRVSKISEFAADNTAGDYVTFEYLPFVTTIKDSRNHMEKKYFFKNGQTMSIQNEDGYAVFSSQSPSGSLLGVSDVQIPGENNLLKNWDFKDQKYVEGMTNPPVPQYWTSTSSSFYPAFNTGPAGISSYAWPGATGNVILKQRVQMDFKKGESFSYGGWAKADTSYPLDKDIERSYGMRVEIPKENDVNSTEVLDSFDFNPYLSHNFSGSYSNWQYNKSSFTLPRDVSYIDVCFVLENQPSYFYVTGAELQRDALYYTVDESGDIAKAPGEDADAPQPILEHTDEETKDEYDRVTKSISAAGVGQLYTYDDYGNMTSSAVTNGRVKMETVNTYTSGGNYLASTTDPLGNTTQYTYHTSLGTLNSMTDPRGSTTTYTYDAMQRLAGVSQPVTGLADDAAQLQNSYTYENDRLKTISHNGFEYTFSYDKWGNPQSVKAGTQTLLTNSYTNHVSKLLNTVQYGNGQKIRYTYDSKDRPFYVYYDGAASYRFAYSYTARGELKEKRDYDNRIRTVYSDGLTKEYRMNTDSTYTFLHSYAESDGKRLEKIGDRLLTTRLESDADGKPIRASYDVAAGKTMAAELRYDDLGRLTNRGASLTSNGTANPLYWVNYLYKELPGLKSSEQVYAMDYTFGGSQTQFNHTYTYSYDAAGNITSVSKNGELRQSYVYDEAGQLVRVNDLDQNRTITYQYDAGGNIRSRKEYAYTTGELGTATGTANYTYGNANWKDLLTSYDGKAITYDAIGNPLTYEGWTYTWEAGRQLKLMAKDGSTIDYKYDDGGIRTQKTVDGTTTSYILMNGRVTAEETSGAWTYYRYDADGNLLSLNWNGAEYAYVKNLQGDIIGLVDETGTLVVEYTYDAWGVPVSVTGSLADTLGHANPYRYRGYRWDSETGLYYLQSRYYNPEWGRFINADDTAILNLSQNYALGANLFAYCYNNPVTGIDSTGEGGILGAIIGGIFAAGTFFLEYKLGMRSLNWWIFGLNVAAAAALGFVGGYISSWAKFLKIAKHARIPTILKSLKSPLLRKIIPAVTKGITFLINSFIKSLSRKPGESWGNMFRRVLKI